MEIYKDLSSPATQQFEKLLNSQLSKNKIEEGKIIEGKVTKVTSKYIFLFIPGLKSEPVIDINEIKLIGMSDGVKEGDIISVLLEKIEDKNGEVLVSAQKAQKIKGWNKLVKCYEKNELINGKIIQINTNNYEYKIISKGHRNPQGLFYDNENDFILSTEHGPLGGDEINLIKLNLNNIQNFGWPLASYGEHYSDPNKIKIKKYPLMKSHKNNGFIEPLKYFVPSIGISEIIKIDKKNYVASSLKDKSLYFFGLNEKNKIVDLKKIQVFERVRDLIFKNKKLYLFLENTPSLGIIEIR